MPQTCVCILTNQDFMFDFNFIQPKLQQFHCEHRVAGICVSNHRVLYIVYVISTHTLNQFLYTI